ncbi:Oidioi.mRNA.OKI2018_I69.chr1.g900.t1.cds [Oikopleura dioica]|uniref:Oidioi.mRNA.OKI2018_I69.chr1.g900.t1.cds n=1 Tax=Oikopleura dioica TaxID=34765 RepID=A0ABN7SQ39_OIKDI|nr:Oidioi.mRNA.OKI2018_I69.chr1.g900.t1.cds [Oikopleura dioica]
MYQQSNFPIETWGDPRKLDGERSNNKMPIASLPTQSLNAASLASNAFPASNSNRDTEWLKVEVCREFMRGACKRSEDECKFAHPQSKCIVVENGKVTACFDSLKGKCHREFCKYLHPSPHIKNQLEINGRNAQMNKKLLQNTTQMGVLSGVQPLSIVQTPVMILNQEQPATIKGIRPDRLEICRDYIRSNCERGIETCKFAHPPLDILQKGDQSMIDTSDNTVIVCMDAVKGRCQRPLCKYFHPPSHLIMINSGVSSPMASFQLQSQQLENKYNMKYDLNGQQRRPSGVQTFDPIQSSQQQRASSGTSLNLHEEYSSQNGGFPTTSLAMPMMTSYMMPISQAHHSLAPFANVQLQQNNWAAQQQVRNVK